MYLNFYHSVDKFIKEISRTQGEQEIGKNPPEVATLQALCKPSFPLYLSQYLEVLGPNAHIYPILNQDFIVSNFSVRKALKLVNSYPVLEFLRKLNTEKADSFIPIYYDDSRAQVVFVNAESPFGESYLLEEFYPGDDGEVYDPEDLILSPYYNFIQNIRERIFLGIKFFFGANRESKVIDLSKIDWVQFHRYYHQKRHSNYETSFSRRDFMAIVEDSRNNSLLSLPEYERLYIQFLIEQKGVPPIPDVYNPYIG